MLLPNRTAACGPERSHHAHLMQRVMSVLDAPSRMIQMLAPLSSFFHASVPAVFQVSTAALPGRTQNNEMR